MLKNKGFLLFVLVIAVAILATGSNYLSSTLSVLGVTKVTSINVTSGATLSDLAGCDGLDPDANGALQCGAPGANYSLLVSGLGPYLRGDQHFLNTQATVHTIFASGHGFTDYYGNGTVSLNDLTTYAKGNQSLSIATEGGGEDCGVQKAWSSQVWNLTGKYVRIWVMCNDTSNLAYLQLLFSGSKTWATSYTFKFQDDMTQLKNNTWTPLTASFSSPFLVGTPDRSALNYTRLTIRDKAGKSVKVWFGGIEFFPEPAKATIALTFDDGWSTQYTEARRVMDAYGFVGTAYIIPSRVGTAGYMTLAQLTALHNAGWEIAGHYDTWTSFNSSQKEKALLSVKNYLISNGFSSGMEDFAYPNGYYDEATVIPLMRKYFQSARTITEYEETMPPADPLKLKSNLKVRSTQSWSYIKTKIDNAITNKELLVITYHKLVPNASLAVSSEHNVSLFAKTMQYIYNNSAQVNVRTINDIVKNDIPATYNTTAQIRTSVNVSKYYTLKVNHSNIQNHADPQAENQGLVAWTYDPSAAVNTYTLATKGTGYGFRIYLNKAVTISNIYNGLSTAGAALKDCHVSLYQLGTRIYTTTNQTWDGTTGLKTYAITPAALTADPIDIIMWCKDWSTAPTFARAAGAGWINIGLSGSTSRYFAVFHDLNDTSPNTLGSKLTLSISLWGAVN